MRFDALSRPHPPTSVADLAALVVRNDKFSATFTRTLLQVDGLYLWAIFRGAEWAGRVPPVGSLVRVRGTWKVFGGAHEVEVDLVEMTAQSPRWPGGRTTRSAELLGLRSLVIREMHALFREWDYMPVDSPTIVSDWVVGDTVPFDLQFYGRKQYLSISNMLYHQMLACNGFNQFYEIGPLFRRETPSNRRKLAAFTILDISRVGVGISDVMRVYESLISASIGVINRHAHFATGINTVEFETIDWSDLVSRVEGHGGDGSQLNAASRAYLNECYSSFVWVTGFPVAKRPFYTKATGGVSHDCQLWYRGVLYLVAGSEVETDPEILRAAIRAKRSHPQRYRDFLDVVDAGMPIVSMAGMGIERFLALVIPQTTAADFAVQPRYEHAHIF